jgi:prepilin-type N-terminal cleavage/methylation domain-containing protein/prepilin-type processing-associated H-X9-DG protein
LSRALFQGVIIFDPAEVVRLSLFTFSFLGEVSMSQTHLFFLGSGRERRAFTLVELLVVIAIIGILIALLLPAVQAAREAARRAQCTNNLKQIGLALHNYHDTYKSFPTGMVLSLDASGGHEDTVPVWGWSALVLPFLEQKSLHEIIGVSKRSLQWAVTNQPDELQTPLDSFICPSSKARPLNADNDKQIPPVNTGLELGTSTYPGVAGTAYGNNADAGYGVLVCQWPDWARKNTIRFADISDGTSNVFAVGERQSDPCHSAVWAGCSDGKSQKSVLGRCNVKINSATACENGFNSFHPGGANFLFCDGSVSFISETVEFKQESGGGGNDYHPNQAPGPNNNYVPPGVYQLLAAREDGWPVTKP